MLNINTLLNRKQRKLSEILNKNFWDLYLEWKKSSYTRYVCKGGRGSAKSTHIAIILILTLIAEPVNIVCFRKVAETLETSVYEQIKKVIYMLELEEYFIFKKSPLQIIYKERGNMFLFRGLDKAEKVKSIVTSKFPITIYWFEEFQEHNIEQEIETAIKSILRGELEDYEYTNLLGEKKIKKMKYRGIFSYNPLRQKQHWINKKYSFSTVDKNTFVHTSNYLKNRYISKEFIEEAEALKERDYTAYRWEYLGEPVGQGVVPFPNLILRRITDQELRSFDNFRNGLDWGYGVDPVAFVRWHWDSTRQILYAVDEFYGIQKSNKQVAAYINKKRYRESVTCDSAEPKSVAEMRSYGVKAVSAKKGKGSVEYGEKWLGEITIIIDPQRTPNIAREFEQIDYATDRWGEPLPRLEDKNNHTIDATRYAMEMDMKRHRKGINNKIVRPKGF